MQTRVIKGNDNRVSSAGCKTKTALSQSRWYVCRFDVSLLLYCSYCRWSWRHADESHWLKGTTKTVICRMENEDSTVAIKMICLHVRLFASLLFLIVSVILETRRRSHWLKGITADCHPQDGKRRQHSRNQDSMSTVSSLCFCTVLKTDQCRYSRSD